MLKSTAKEAKVSTTAPLVVAVRIQIVNRIVGAAIHVLAKIDIMCLKAKVYRMPIVRQ